MRTLIIIDMQNDFMPGGALPVPEGDQVISIINGMQNKFDLVIATQDWHPSNHISFATNHSGKKPFDTVQLENVLQVLWPDHCVQGSTGAAFHSQLEMNNVEAIFRKGMDRKIDSYSGFYDNGHQKNTGLGGFLRDREATDLFFCGLAADFCVAFSVKDALKEGFSATLIDDATKPIEREKYATLKKELKRLGCNIVRNEQL